MHTTSTSPTPADFAASAVVVPTMRAMMLSAPLLPLEMEWRNIPEPGPGELRLRVLACAVCRTDLHIVDGELPLPVLPIVPGHEIVGVVEAIGSGGTGHRLGDRVGVPWLGHSCGCCAYCTSGHENLCDAPRFTGYHRDGGFASHVIAEAAFCLPLDMPEADAVRIAPLLCAGLIGWHSLKAAGEDARRLGIFGFGAAAHLVTQAAIAQAARFSHSPGPRTVRRRRSRAASAQRGPAAQTSDRRSRWTRPSSSRPPVNWYRPRCASCARAVAWCAAASR